METVEDLLEDMPVGWSIEKTTDGFRLVRGWDVVNFCRTPKQLVATSKHFKESWSEAVMLLKEKEKLEKRLKEIQQKLAPDLEDIE